MRECFARRPLLALLIGALPMLIVPAASARTDNRTKPLIFVRGLDAFGEAGVDCAGTWNNMANRLTTWGWSGTKTTVKYYGGDTNCSHALDHHGSHSTHYQRTDGHTGTGSHDMDGDIRHLGYHLAWMIYDHYSSAGVTVDAVGHSMGGLILRYALHRIQANDPAFPPYLYVEDVNTLGTPHLGSGWASGCTWSYECVQMENGSSFINYLSSSAKNPQADGGTDWTATGSYDDGIVAEGSAVGMAAAHKVNYIWPSIGHRLHARHVRHPRRERRMVGHSRTLVLLVQRTSRGAVVRLRAVIR